MGSIPTSGAFAAARLRGLRFFFAFFCIANTPPSFCDRNEVRRELGRPSSERACTTLLVPDRTHNPARQEPSGSERRSQARETSRRPR